MSSSSEINNQVLAPPDLSLIKPIEIIRADHATHVDHYTKGDKHLYFVGTKHSSDFETVSHHLLSQTLEQHKPDFVIVEGLPTRDGISPITYNFNYPQQVENFKRLGEEYVHVAELARQKNILFVGGEVSHEDKLAALQAKGYTTKEYMGHFLVRAIPQWRRTNNMPTKEKMKEAIERLFAKSPAFEMIPKDQRMTYDEFVSWYDSHKSELGGKDFSLLNEIDSVAYGEGGHNYFQKMSAIHDQARDEHLAKLIAESLNKHDKVMVCYGAAHQQKLEPLLTKMFDSQPENVRLKLTPENDNKQKQGDATVQPVTSLAASAPAHSIAVEPCSSAFEAAPSSASKKWLLTAGAALISLGLVAASFGGAVVFAAVALAGAATLAYVYYSANAVEKSTSAPIMLKKPMDSMAEGHTPTLEKQKNWVAGVQKTGELEQRMR